MGKMKSNFDFLMAYDDTAVLADSARNAERLYVQGIYDAEFSMIRKVIENVAKKVVDFNYAKLSEHATFNDHLRYIKDKGLVEPLVLDVFYDLKSYGNKAAHSLDNIDKLGKAEGIKGLSQMLKVLLWFTNKYTGQKISNRVFFEPQKESVYKTAERKLIYVHQVDNSSGKLPLYDGLEKVGEASTPADDLEADWTPNSEFLREIADKRINQYMETAGLPHNTQWAELAYRKSDKTWFHDYDVHEVLRRSGVKKSVVTNGNEWYETDVDTVRKAIAAVKAGQSAIDVPVPAESKEIVLRPEQNAAVVQTKKVFAKKSGRKMLWNAKMRFGKTLTALQLIKDEQFEKVLIMTHRPVVSDSWFDDFRKMKMTAAGYERGSKTTGKKLPELLNIGKPFVYFASIQDLRGSKLVGGKAGDKNRDLFETDWDLVIIDEAHEGTQTELAENVLKAVVKDNTKTLELSGTPFNLLDQYEDDNVYTWDYVMEQQAKQRWENEHPGEPNPYESLPKVSMYTFEMKNKEDYSDVSKSFNFKEFFKVDEDGHFVHEADVDSFLDEITKPDSKTNYPFSTEEYREELRHTLWLMPGVKEATALEGRLNAHKVFGSGGYKIVNVVADGKEDNASESDLQKVRDAITDEPSETKTITLTVRKLTTGVNVREWTAVMFLSNTNSAMQYLQAAFRAQTPFSDEKLGMQTNSYIFDFAPDRALTVMAESSNLGSRPGKRISREQKNDMRRLLNFMPIIGATGNGMKSFSVDSLLTKIKHVYAEKAVRSGFEDDSLYSDELLMNLDKADLKAFNDLKALVGTTQAEKKPMKVKVNDEGLTDEEYEVAERAKKRKKKERTPEEQAALDKMKIARRQKKTMISVLRGISIRIPMMIYGMNIDIDSEVDVQTLINQVDDKSWEEFMPAGVTKGIFREFKRYYDPEVFVEAGQIIRRKVRALDELDPIARAEKLSVIFSTFKNPDKETVLTPWRVVNKQLDTSLGGLSFYNDDYSNMTIDGVSATHWVDSKYTDEVYTENSKFLEINSKTGLYPLYVAVSLYWRAFEKINNDTAGKFTVRDEQDAWQKVLRENVFVVAKTPMAATITQRTLSGYRDYETNVEFIDGIVDTAQKDVADGVRLIEKVFDNMKFDVVIGNPPYQESDNDSGNGSGKPLYHYFIEMAINLNPDFVTLITPSVWFTGGKGLDAFRNKMLHDKHIEQVFNYVTPKEVFPTANLRGGVNYFLWSNSYDNEENGVLVETIKNGAVQESGKRPMTFDGLDLFLSSNISFDIIRRMTEQNQITLDIDSKDMMGKYVSVRNPFGFATTFTKTEGFKSDASMLAQPVKMFASGGRTGYVERDSIKRNLDWIDRVKVLTPFANNIGTDLQDDNLNVIVAGKNEIVTETYLVIGADLDLTQVQAENIGKYLQTKFVRYLISLAKANQNGTRSTYLFVPMQDFSSESDLDFDTTTSMLDVQLFAKYNFTEREIEHVKQSVQDME